MAMKESKRHRWTKDELAKLQRTVSQAKHKGKAFEKIASEMSLSKTAVAGTYYNYMKKRQSGAVKRAGVSVSVGRPVEVGRPFDFSSYSERELFELSQSINAEVSRRMSALRELGQMFDF